MAQAATKPSKKPNKSISIRFNPEQRKCLKKVAEIQGKTEQDVLRDALNLYDVALEIRLNGGEVFFVQSPRAKRAFEVAVELTEMAGS